MEKLNGETLNIVNENIEKLKQLFPEAFREGKIDFETLKAELGESVENAEERYSFNWNGKAAARRIAQTPSTGTLRPCPAESVDWDTTQNLFLEGDNLEVLKLLQKSYHAKVKMIYIDPPYNTGKEFIYPDNFHDNLDTYLQYTGQKDADGRKFGTNADTSGRYHTNWLNMMYPRLKLARNLLRDDGVIFISIDDNEVHNLRKIGDEIFGEGNFIGNICHKARASVSNDKIISSNHNHILLYAKNGNIVFENRKSFGLNPNLDGFDKEDEKGKYKYTPVDGPGGARKGNPYYTFEGVTGFFRYSEETMRDKFNRGLVVKVGESLQQKYYLEDAKNTRKTDTTWWDEKLYTSTATTRLKDLMDGDYFTNPKHVDLIIRTLTLSTVTDDLVLDFFAGSATTAHAVMKLNAEDGGNRRCISVQLPEPCDDKSEAYKAGYKTIAEISKERIRRAAKKIAEENPEYKGDLGFKVFKLDSSNIKSWDADFTNVEQSLLDAVDNIKSDRTSEDLLYEILLKYGLDLTLPIETRDVGSKRAYILGYGALIICLDDDVTLDTVSAIAALKEEFKSDITRVVFKDGGFANDVVKTNAIQTLKQHGIDDVKSV